VPNQGITDALDSLASQCNGKKDYKSLTRFLFI